mmetsp:Transcript_39674/g.112545  ORF Transcript_39674/g.112545 Transcript_39674/m.112545 type:complete len:669 (+) Transcript_39674:213-2219(+)|eukprot:CAMPEP_0117655484 /NCGR_PEP_ID=MMETSP0804-20121206/4302_1 /TAXON_ID=1074897 /ORGANISM="Tetraselmis astigmatica, Strain CCMP880" /LENGTH=668 /DNA_ID=CAMNT_0005461835 /DNA_START=1465 /DNA_END=3471 /DNA_ORIENTATION=+
MSSTIVKEGFEVDEAYVKSVQRLQIDVKASALPDLRPMHMNSKVGINGLLQLCNISSPCQIATVNYADGQTTPMAWGIEVVGGTNLDPRCRRLVRTVSRGIRAQQEPEAATDGLGGTYFFMNESGKKAALMKPCDEEPFAPNNPKGFVGRSLGDPGMKTSVKVGEAAIREVAAYLLDHDHRAQVPATVLVRASHPIFHFSERPEPTAAAGRGSVVLSKLGSLQEFTAHTCDSSEVGASRFNAKNIHRIGILDLRLLNTDRHAGNLLVRPPNVGSSTSHLGLGAMLMESSQLELIPIDHGFCLPDSLEAPYFEWLHWPQGMLPFDEEELEYIRELDPEQDIAMLKQKLPMLRDDCLRMLWLSTVLLKRCAAAGHTLSEIGEVYSRPLVGMDEEPSELERLCMAAWQHLQDTRVGKTGYSLEEDEYFGEECSDCEEGNSEEADASWGVSDSASSHLRTPHKSSKALAGRPAEVEDVHDSPASDCQLVCTPASQPDLQFDLDEDAGTTPLGGAHTPGHLVDKSLSGEADSWSLAAFSVSSLSFNGKEPQPKAGLQLVSPSSDEDSSDEELQEHAASLGMVSGLQRWRRHDVLGKHMNSTGPRRPRNMQAMHSTPPVGELGNLGDLSSADWEVFLEGFCGHLDAALQAGVWKAANQRGMGATRNLFGKSAPC